MASRSSSVSLPHCSFTLPLICFQFPSTRFQSIANTPLVGGKNLRQLDFVPRFSSQRSPPKRAKLGSELKPPGKRLLRQGDDGLIRCGTPARSEIVPTANV